MNGASRQGTWWLATALYFAACSLGHLQFSLWLVRERQFGGQVMAFADLVPVVAAAGAAALLAWIAWQGRRQLLPRRWFAAWGCWLLAVLLIDRYLTFSLNEAAHYPQYGLLAWLVGRSLVPDRQPAQAWRVLFWTTLLGMADECLQYLWITTSYSDYLDFNDFLVNLVAAAGGALVYFAPAGADRGVARTSTAAGRGELLLATALALTIAAALASGRLLVEPVVDVAPGGATATANGAAALAWQRRPGLYGGRLPGPRHGEYRVLDPATGGTLLLVTGLAFAGMIRRLRVPPPVPDGGSGGLPPVQ